MAEHFQKPFKNVEDDTVDALGGATTPPAKRRVKFYYAKPKERQPANFNRPVNSTILPTKSHPLTAENATNKQQIGKTEKNVANVNAKVNDFVVKKCAQKGLNYNENIRQVIAEYESKTPILRYNPLLCAEPNDWQQKVHGTTSSSSAIISYHNNHTQNQKPLTNILFNFPDPNMALISLIDNEDDMTAMSDLLFPNPPVKVAPRPMNSKSENVKKET